MLGPDCLLTATTDLSQMAAAFSLLGYVGLGPGPEFIPYFMALMGVLGAALLAVVQWPISLLLGRLNKLRQRGKHAETPLADETTADSEIGGGPTR